MIREIVKDSQKLMIKSVEATINDLCIIDDMIDTAKANNDICVGLAANQIGESIRIIIVEMGGYFVPLVNPKKVIAKLHMKQKKLVYHMKELKK